MRGLWAQYRLLDRASMHHKNLQKGCRGMNDTCSYDRKWGTGRKGVGERAELSCFFCVCVCLLLIGPSTGGGKNVVTVGSLLYV